MKKIMIILFLFSCSHNHERLNSRKLSSQYEPNKNYNPYGPISILSSMNEEKRIECARHICGREVTNTSISDLMKAKEKRFLYTVQSKEYKEFDQIINRMLETNFNSFRKLYSEIQKVKSQKNKISDIIEPLKRLLIADYLNDVLPITKVHNGVRVTPRKPNYMRSLHENSDLSKWDLSSEKEKDLIRNVIKSGYYSQMASVLKPIDIDADGYLKNHYPSLSKSQAVYQLALHCNQLRRKILVDHLGFDENYNFAFSCAHPASSKNLEMVSKSKLYHDFVTVYKASAVLSSDFDGKIPETIDFLFSNILQEFQESISSHYLKPLAPLLNKSYLKATATIKARQTCHQVIGDAIETSSSKLLRRKFLAYTEDVKNVAKNIIHFKDPLLQEQFILAIEHTSFALPESRQAISSRMKSVFQEQTRKIDSLSPDNNHKDLFSKLIFHMFYNYSDRPHED